MINKLNKLAARRIPFFFMIDYDMEKPVLLPLSQIDPARIKYNFNGQKNFTPPEHYQKLQHIDKELPAFNEYKKAFHKIQNHFINGNSYLVNLTFAIPIYTAMTLEDIFYNSRAKYKILYKNRFVCFSPEIFVKIKNGYIYSYPMKGTIDSTLPDAARTIINDSKEKAEHITIVDLIRNDLNISCTRVKVNRFRYIDKLTTSEKELLQVSSEIEAQLPADYLDRLGNIIYSLLPAGSISGAPKKKTLEIINETENYKRGYYTGIAALFNGSELDSCVMIRFIEKQPKKMVYKSGGGITVYSSAAKEYQELKDKIYVPVSGNN